MNSVGRCRKKPVTCCVENFECIYNLLPQSSEVIKKPPLYKSKYSSLIKQQVKNQKKFSHRTLGLARGLSKPSKEFLKKQSKNPKVFAIEKKKDKEVSGNVSATSPCKILEEQKKQEIVVPCPSKKVTSTKDKVERSNDAKDKTAQKSTLCDGKLNDEVNSEGSKKSSKKSSKKNFISKNVRAMRDTKPPKTTTSTKKLTATTRMGDKQDFEGAGLDMKLCRSETFGKKPKYLDRRRKQIEAARDEYDDKISEKMRAGALKKLSPEERENMLVCLQEKHENLYQQYNRLPILIQTSLMKNRKMRLENLLAQLEKDIRLVSAHPEIYLARDVQTEAC